MSDQSPHEGVNNDTLEQLLMRIWPEFCNQLLSATKRSENEGTLSEQVHLRVVQAFGETGLPLHDQSERERTVLRCSPSYTTALFIACALLRDENPASRRLFPPQGLLDHAAEAGVKLNWRWLCLKWKSIDLLAYWSLQMMGLMDAEQHEQLVGRARALCLSHIELLTDLTLTPGDTMLLEQALQRNRLLAEVAAPRN